MDMQVIHPKQFLTSSRSITSAPESLPDRPESATRAPVPIQAPTLARNLAPLRHQVRLLERNSGAGGPIAGVATGIAAIDACLPSEGLQRGALHQVEAASARHEGAGASFLLWLLGRLAGLRPTAPILWCRRESFGFDAAPYPPGLLPWLDPARLFMAQPKAEADVLWALEEGLRTPGLAAVVGELRRLDLVSSRRLMLAGESSGVPVLLLHPAATGVSAAATRWRIAAAPSLSHSRHLLGAPRWQVELLRARGGGTAGAERNLWILEWNHETGDLAVAAAPADRPAEPGHSRLAG